jgi:uncharacterized protein (TIGR00251 family)
LASQGQVEGRLRVRVQPNASRSEVTGFAEGVALVRVAAPPVGGKANRELSNFLGQTLGVAPSAVTIIRGQTSRLKLIAVAGLATEEIARRLAVRPSSSGATRRSKG